jgi:hypothetical protein
MKLRLYNPAIHQPYPVPVILGSTHLSERALSAYNITLDFPWDVNYSLRYAAGGGLYNPQYSRIEASVEENDAGVTVALMPRNCTFSSVREWGKRTAIHKDLSTKVQDGFGSFERKHGHILFTVRDNSCRVRLDFM